MMFRAASDSEQVGTAVSFSGVGVLCGCKALPQVHRGSTAIKFISWPNAGIPINARGLKFAFRSNVCISIGGPTTIFRW